MSANFTPDMTGYKGLSPFRFWCQKTLPLVYDDSLSYYELLCKVVNYINNLITDVAAAEENVDKLLTAYNQLQEYVNNYFDGEDFQQKIDDSLDRYAEDGTLSRMVNTHVSALLPYEVGQQIGPVVDEDLGPVVDLKLPAVVESKIAAPVATQLPAVVQTQIGGVVGNQIGDVVADQIDEVVADQITDAVSPLVHDEVTGLIRPAVSAELPAALHVYLPPEVQTQLPGAIGTDLETIAPPVIEDWLDAHPEATTSVPDGSISFSKLATDLQRRAGIVGTYFPSDFTNEYAWQVNQYAVYQGIVYRCIKTTTAGQAWNASEWTTANMNSDLFYMWWCLNYLSQSITTIDSSPATTAHEAGEYFIYYDGAHLYRLAKASSNIEVGDTLTPNGNFIYSSVANMIADLKVEIADLKSALSNNFSIGINLIPTETDGKFVDASNNNVSSSDNFALLGPMPVKRGQHVVFNARGYSTVVGMICTCNADNTERQTVVCSIDGTKREYTYDVLSDGFIVLSYVKSDGYELNATIDYYSYINTLNQLEPFFAGSQNVHIVPLLKGFIDPTTNRYNASNSFKTSDSINLFKGQIINFTATGYRTNVSMINLYDANNDTYQSVARSIDSDEQLYSYTAVADCIVRLCYLADTTPTAVIITPQTDFARVVNLETDVAKLQTPIAYPQLFDNILCIGDSLTVGASGNGNEILTKNYPHFLRKLTVAETTIKGHGGYSAKQVWDEYISASTDLSSFDCAVIYLGTNGGLTDTVDSDCNASDYTQNADTNTGCYGKIIGKIKGDAPNCKIFCVAGPSENIRREETMNPAVRELASYYNVGLIDIEKSILADDGSVGSQKRYTYRPVDAIHYNALGYLTLANLICDGIHDYVSENLIKFA